MAADSWALGTGAPEEDPLPAASASAAELRREIAKRLQWERSEAVGVERYRAMYKECQEGLLRYHTAAVRAQLGDEKFIRMLEQHQCHMEHWHAELKQSEAARERYAREVQLLREKLEVAQVLEARGELVVSPQCRPNLECIAGFDRRLLLHFPFRRAVHHPQPACNKPETRTGMQRRRGQGQGILSNPNEGHGATVHTLQERSRCGYCSEIETFFPASGKGIQSTLLL